MTVEQALHHAQQLVAAGKADEAAAVCRQILSVAPGEVITLNLLGAIVGGQGKLEQSAELFVRCAMMAPQTPEYHSNLGLALYQLNRLNDAAVACKAALKIDPNYADAHLTLGNIYQDQSVERDDPALLEQAIAEFEKVTALLPNFARGFHNLGNALSKCGRWDQAIAAYRKAVELDPNLPETFTNLGIALHTQCDFTGAAAAHRRAIALRPDYAAGYNNLGTVLMGCGEPAEAAVALAEARRLDPKLLRAHNNLGSALWALGKVDQAIAQFEDVLAERPEAARIAANRIFLMHFQYEQTPASLAAEMEKWNRHYAEPLALQVKPHSNSPLPDRRLKIGLVSPDLRNHVIGKHLLPYLRLRDRAAFEITCYSTRDQTDAVNESLRAAADGWRDISALGDIRAAERIRADGIDILMDLSLYSGGNRLLLFSRKPAPVQVSHLGYCGCTGIWAIDHFLTDPYINPPDEPAPRGMVRLPKTYWCYPKPEDSLPVAQSSGPIVFGCMNNFAKISPQAWESWQAILAAVPDSRLIVHAPPGPHRDELSRRFGQGRIEFVLRQEPMEYLRVYNRIDISLDPFPYGGGITSCDSLWMGAPVVTLCGRTPVGRGGCSILSNLGLTDLIAQSREEYVDIAVMLAGNRDRLAELRGTLRQRMMDSPLMDAARYARDLEAALRSMWKRYCDAH